MFPLLCSVWYNSEPCNGSKVFIKRRYELDAALLRRRNNRRIGEAQSALALRPEDVKSVEKEVGARDKIELPRAQQGGAHLRCGGEAAPSQKHGDDFKEHVLEKQSLPPLSCQQRLDSSCSRGMMNVTCIVVSDQKTAIENDQRTSAQVS